METITVGENALALAAHGIPVFPCRPDKTPLTPRGFHDATTNADTIRAWWAHYPDSLAGVPTGRASGMVVVDVDPSGMDWAHKHWNALSPMRLHITRRGWHLVYTHPLDREIRCSTGKLALGVDVRGTGGYVVWWPASGLAVQGDKPGVMPPWLSEQIAAPLATAQRTIASVAAGGEKVGEGLRNDYLSREAFRLRKQRASVEQIVEVLRAMNDARCYPPLDDTEVLQIAIGKSRIAPEPGPMDVGFGRAPLPAGVSPVPPTYQPGVELVCAASIRPEAIGWLWRGWLARGKLAILAGVAGTGKSTVAFSLAAAVTIGGHWPDGSRCEAVGNVLIWSAEDDPADTIVPRLMAAGADLNRVHIIRGKMLPNGQAMPFDPAHDVPELHRKIEGVGGVALLIVDPIVSAVSGDMHKANDVRRSLQAVVDLAAQFDCTVVGISHFSKGSKGVSPQERVIGSQAFGALARLVLVCAKDEENDARVLARAKSNISVDTGGFAYSIVPATVANGIETTRVHWGDAMEGSARSILHDVERDAEAEGDQSDECAQALGMALHNAQGRPVEVLSKDVRAKLRAEGYSPKVIRTARERLGVKSRRQGFGQDMKSYWCLPASRFDPTTVGFGESWLPAGASPAPVDVAAAPLAPRPYSAAFPFAPSNAIHALPHEEGANED